MKSESESKASRDTELKAMVALNIVSLLTPWHYVNIFEWRREDVASFELGKWYRSIIIVVLAIALA